MKTGFRKTEEEARKEQAEYREFINNEAVKAIVRMSGIFQES